MPHQHLYALGPEAVLDPQSRGRVPEAMQREFCVWNFDRITVLVLPVPHHHHAGRDLDRPEDPRQDIAVVLNAAGASRKDQVELALAACKLPDAKCVDYHRAERNVSRSSFRFRWAEMIEAI